MAKRGRKPGSTSNSKGRPRTRSQIKPSEDSKKPTSAKSTVSKSKKIKTSEVSVAKTTPENKKKNKI